MFPSPRRTRTWSRRVGLAAAAVTALVLPTLSANATPAAQPAPAAKASAAAVRADIMSGAAAAKYDIDARCSRLKLTCGVRLLTPTHGSLRPLVTTGPSGYGPADFTAAYQPTGSGTGTIAILGAGAYPNLEQDLATYRTQYGLPACTIANGCLTIKSYTGGAPAAPQTGAEGKSTEETTAMETALDVQAASAACPSCHIADYQLPYQDAGGFGDQAQAMKDFGTAADTAVAGNPQAISISYLLSGNADSLTGATAKKFDRPGVAITAASGDLGFMAGHHAYWPAALPTVTAVGGTKLARQGSGFTETVWDEISSHDGAAGSGCESSVGPAVGQPSSVSAYCAGYRAVTDISADADPVTGYSVYDTYTPQSGSGGGWMVVGGTSASTPLIAGYYVRAGNTTAVHGPNTIYAAPGTSLHDVTSGNNEYYATCASDGTAQQVCTAGTGWDGPTGRGTPNGSGAL